MHYKLLLLYIELKLIYNQITLTAHTLEEVLDEVSLEYFGFFSCFSECVVLLNCLIYISQNLFQQSGVALLFHPNVYIKTQSNALVGQSVELPKHY